MILVKCDKLATRHATFGVMNNSINDVGGALSAGTAAGAEAQSKRHRRSAWMDRPEKPRAVFPTEDFRLIRNALAHYLKEVQDQPESVKYNALYHRLGRVS